MALWKGIVEDISVDGTTAKVRIPMIDGIYLGKNSNTVEELPEARICISSGVVPRLQIRDVVYVAFEKGSYTNPVILGVQFSNETNTTGDILAESLTVNSTATLPSATTIGLVTPEEINRLSGVKDNLQQQIDILTKRVEALETQQ